MIVFNQTKSGNISHAEVFEVFLNAFAYVFMKVTIRSRIKES